MKIPQQTRTSARPGNTRRALQRLVCKLLAYALALTLLLVFLGYPYRQSGNAMFPGIRDGDLVLICRPGPACHDEVVAYETQGGTRLGRVVATAGQTVETRRGRLTSPCRTRWLWHLPTRKNVGIPTGVLPGVGLGLSLLGVLGLVIVKRRR